MRLALSRAGVKKYSSHHIHSFGFLAGLGMTRINSLAFCGVTPQDLMEEVLKEGLVVGNDPAKLAEWHVAMKVLIPDRIGEIYGYEYISASRDSFPPLPRAASG
jgi:hypothetical protein